MSDKSVPTDVSTELLDIHPQPGDFGSYEFLSGKTEEFFKFKNSLSSNRPINNSADLRTFPETTQTPIRFPISAISTLVSLSFFLFSNIFRI